VSTAGTEDNYEICVTQLKTGEQALARSDPPQLVFEHGLAVECRCKENDNATVTRSARKGFGSKANRWFYQPESN
jgi:hypothetical protein